MTYKITLCYESREGATFDADYYLNQHIPLAEKTFSEHGLRRVEVNILEQGTSGKMPPYKAVTHMYFDDQQSLKQCMKTAGAEVAADLKNFTDINPMSYMSEVSYESS